MLLSLRPRLLVVTLCVTLALALTVAPLATEAQSSTGTAAADAAATATAEAAANTQVDSDVGQLFASFVRQHNKTYATPEAYATHFATFRDNVHMIRRHNAGNHTYTLAINEFADLSPAELAAQRGRRTGLNGMFSLRNARQRASSRIAEESVIAQAQVNTANFPASLDWRTRGAVTHVKDQGALCDSSWAFSAVGAVEGARAISTGILEPLSEQELIDCSQIQGNQGCYGGLPDLAFNYIRAHRLVSEAAYPYKLWEQACRVRPEDKVASITGYKFVTATDVGLMTALQLRPIVVVIDATSDAFIFYSGGVLDYAECGANYLSNAMLLVGYGTDEVSGMDYWIIKNSWGSFWGDAGYIRIKRNSNMCGIENNFASYPTV